MASPVAHALPDYRGRGSLLQACLDAAVNTQRRSACLAMGLQLAHICFVRADIEAEFGVCG
jgi:hypothetical protein